MRGGGVAIRSDVVAVVVCCVWLGQVHVTCLCACCAGQLWYDVYVSAFKSRSGVSCAPDTAGTTPKRSAPIVPEGNPRGNFLLDGFGIRAAPRAQIR